jgi:hypothetical protein
MTELATPSTAAGLLFGPAGAARTLGALRPRLAAGGLGGLSPAGFEGAVQAFSTAVADLLQLDLVGLLVGGWRTHQDLRAAADRTVGSPAVEVIEIGRHSVTSEQQPYVDLLLNGVRVGTVHFGLSVTLDLAAAVATVRAGALVDVRPSRCTVTLRLTCEGEAVAARTAQLALPGVLSFGAGHPLVAAQPGPVAGQP